MKKVIFVLTMLMAAGISMAQMPEKFVKAMEARVPAVDTTATAQGFLELANAFERIAEAEKNQWLPYYYAALCHVNSGLMMTGDDIMSNKTDKTDPIADKAEALIVKAEALSREHSEIYIVKKQIASLRLIGDPMSRYMIYGAEAAAALEKARALNPENPRVYLLEAQDKFYTPEQFGGSKDEAKVLFEKAQKLFESFKPETSIHPAWGKTATAYFLSQYQ